MVAVPMAPPAFGQHTGTEFWFIQPRVQKQTFPRLTCYRAGGFIWRGFLQEVWDAVLGSASGSEMLAHGVVPPDNLSVQQHVLGMSGPDTTGAWS